MSFFAISALVNAITSILLGYLVWSKEKRNRLNIIFALFAFSVTAWSLAYFFWQISSGESEALFWVKLLMAPAIFIPFLYFHFIAVFLKIEARVKWLIVISYSLGLLFLAANFSDLFVEGVSLKLGFQFWPTAGGLFTPFLLAWFVYVLLAPYHLFKNLALTKGVEYHQIRYMLVGTIIGYTGGATNYFLWYGIPIAPYGNILVSMYVILVAYAVLKHHLFDLRAIASELLVFSLWIVVLVRTLLAKTLEDQIGNAGLLIATIIIGIALIRSATSEVRQREKIEKLAHNLETANTRLRELDKLKSEFVSIASHQLRSPLTAIKGLSSMIIGNSYGKAPQKIREAVEKIFESSQLMVLSVEDFLNVSRIEQGKLKYDKTEFGIGELVQTAVEEMQPVVEGRGLKIEFKKPEGDGFKINADLGKIKQVFSNLIDNSVKYTPKGTITVRLQKKDRKILFSVSDTGVGIPKETLPKLFERFVRASDAFKINTSGSGLDLYIARQIVEAHGGRIWAESEGKGKGSTFLVELGGV